MVPFCRFLEGATFPAVAMDSSKGTGFMRSRLDDPFKLETLAMECPILQPSASDGCSLTLTTLGPILRVRFGITGLFAKPQTSSPTTINSPTNASTTPFRRWSRTTVISPSIISKPQTATVASMATRAIFERLSMPHSRHRAYILVESIWRWSMGRCGLCRIRLIAMSGERLELAMGTKRSEIFRVSVNSAARSKRPYPSPKTVCIR